MCFPTNWRHCVIQTDEFGEVVDTESYDSLYWRVQSSPTFGDFGWEEDDGILAVVFHTDIDEIWYFKSEYTMYFCHLFFGTPLL